MPYQEEAYDFSLFESHYDNTVPVPRREQQGRTQSNVVELPKKELEKNARPKRHPVRAVAAALGFAVAISIATAMVYSQEQLAMLTVEINEATQTLKESESLEVQLNMQAAQKMNSSQVEAYAVGELGMNKIGSGQITYVNVAQQDKGTVVQSADGGSILDRVLAKFRSWLAE